MSTKTKTKEIVINNTTAGRNQLKSARAKVYAAQNDPSIEIFSMLLNICGLFDINLGILATAFNGTVQSRKEYLNKCYRVYTLALESLQEHKDSNSASYFPYAIITHTFKGTYQGANKGYVYKADDVSYNVYRY